MGLIRRGVDNGFDALRQLYHRCVTWLMPTQKENVYIYTYMCIYVLMYAYMYVCMYIYVYVDS